MKKISRRNFLLASGVVTIGAALAACGGSSSTSTASSAAPASSAAASEAPAAAQALISPLRATYCACGALAWISGISGPFGPCGTDAVVITGIFARVAIFANAAARARSSGIGMSPTVWNRPLW